MRILLLLAASTVVAACATTSETTDRETQDRVEQRSNALRMQGVFLRPAVAPYTWVYENGRARRVSWADFRTEGPRRALYNGADNVFGVWRLQNGAEIEALGSQATVARGSYRLRYRFQLYRETLCNPTQPSAGTIRTGVGLEVLADIHNSNRNLDISSLGPIAAAAQNNEISGNISVSVIGIGTADGFLSSYLANGTELTFESVSSAMNAVAVMQALLNDTSKPTVPSYLQAFPSFHDGNTDTPRPFNLNDCVPGIQSVAPLASTGRQ